MAGQQPASPLGGIGLAWLMYVRQPALAGRAGPQQRRACTSCRCNKFHVDELYDAFIVQPLRRRSPSSAGSSTCTSWTAWWTWSGRCRGCSAMLFRPIQNGLVQFYALAMVLGLTVFLLALVRRWSMPLATARRTLPSCRDSS